MDQQIKSTKNIIEQLKEEQEQYVLYVGKLQLSLQLSKYCARNCNLFRDLSRQDLINEEVSCLRRCAENIGLTFPRFVEDVHASLADMEQ